MCPHCFCRGHLQRSRNGQAGSRGAGLVGLVGLVFFTFTSFVSDFDDWQALASYLGTASAGAVGEPKRRHQLGLLGPRPWKSNGGK